MPPPASYADLREAIEGGAVLHIRLEQSLVGFVDLLDGDDLDVGGDVMCPAKVEHLVGLDDAADGCRRW
jgi:hypothetical protein